MNRRIVFILVILIAGLFLLPCNKKALLPDDSTIKPDSIFLDLSGAFFTIPIKEDISLGDYFHFMDSLVQAYDSLLPYDLSEHLLVRTNAWIIDTFCNTDYYNLMERGIFNEDNRELRILKKGDRLKLPDIILACRILDDFENTVIDLNIPEYKMRIIKNRDTLFTFAVRVGRNERKYLATVGRTVSLRTMPGEGQIIRINRNPTFVNPSDGRRFTHTRRDDGKTTLMPLIPWIEPELNGRRYGHLMHPTTNLKTLGRAYSNGCVGLREGDSWRLYYYAPLGTKVIFRYELEVINDAGDSIRLKDIYY